MSDEVRRPPKSVRTRARLLDTTAAVIARRGFSGTRLVDIGEEAGVQASAIYYHFSSREELIEEVMHVGARTMLEHLRDALDALGPDASPTERVGAAVEAHLRTELDISDYSKAIIRNANQLPPAVAERALKLVAEYNAIWRDLIAALDDAGQLRPGLDRAAARMVVLGALNWAAEWFDPGQGPIEPVIGTARTMVLGALVG